MNGNTLHILFLPRWYPNRYDPMPGLFVRRHAEAAAKFNRISIVYVHADERAAQLYEIVSNNEQNLFTINVYFRQSKNKLLNFWRFIRANCQGIRTIIDLYGLPDITHVHVLTRLALVAWWLKLRYGIPFLITEHWSRYIKDRDKFNGFARKWLTRLLVRQAVMVTTVTQNLAEAMQYHKLRNPDYRIIPNIVDTETFSPQTTKQNDLKRIVHISCFEDRSKNISGLLSALKELGQKRDDFECVMIGDGMDFDAMKALSEKYGLAEKVVFTGLQEGAKLAETLASGNFMVLFSNYENLPVVIPEALACGLPVVATRVGGIAELIGEHNGILVEARNEQQLAEAMNRMLDEYPKYKPETLRSPIVAANSPEAVGKLLNNWYSEIYNHKSSQGRIS